MKRKIVALWAISCLAVSSAKAQFYTVSDNVCRYKVKKVEEKFLLPANQPVDSIVTIPSTPYFIKPSLFRTLQFKTTKSSKNV